MKFSQLTEYDKKNILNQKSSIKLGRETFARSLSKIALHEVNVKGLQLNFNIFQ